MPGKIVFDSVARRRMTNLVALAEARAGRMLEVTAPIYWFDERERPNALGSAVLLTLGPWRFLATAAHVMKERHKRRLYTPAGGAIIPIAGELTTLYQIDAASEEEDAADITVVRLAGEAWNQAPTSAFASWDELDVEILLPERHVFSLLGYPATKQRDSVKGDRVEAAAYRSLAIGASSQLYTALGRNPEVNLVLGFDKRRMWGPDGMSTAPNLEGMSGSGVWRFGPTLETVTGPPRLAAILIEWHRRGRDKHVVATRIRPIIAALRERYADVAAWLEGH